MKKIDIEFCLSDDSVNVYGYRLLTNGLQLDRYQPPIGMLMHDREAGVAVRWEDLTIRSGALYGKPVVNDVKFPALAQQIEEGFYNAASVGHIVALEWTDDPAYKLEGQTGPTVTKWFPREISICDIPGNYDAIAKLYDESNNLLMDLTDNNDFLIDRTMNLPNLTPADMTLLNLSAGATPAEVSQALQELVARANKADALQKQLDELTDKVNEEKATAILEKALADKKVFPQVAEHLKKAYAGNPEGLQELVDTMPVQTSIADIVQKEEVPADLASKSYDELWREGKLADVKEKYPNYYEQLTKRGE